MVMRQEVGASYDKIDILRQGESRFKVCISTWMRPVDGWLDEFSVDFKDFIPCGMRLRIGSRGPSQIRLTRVFQYILRDKS